MRIPMHFESLERYLLSKLKSRNASAVESVKICRVADVDGTCNWDIEGFEPDLPRELVERFKQEVVEPMRAAIEIVD